jgi:hypothetical protein
LDRAVISYLLGVDATVPARSYSATALRNNLVRVLRRDRFDVPAKDKDARALIEGLLAALELRVLHQDATDSAALVQGRLRRKGTAFWFEDTLAGTAPLAGAAARPGSAEARADALLAELAASRIGIIYLPVEYDQPKRKSFEARVSSGRFSWIRP